MLNRTPLIMTGWDAPTPARFVRELPAFEAHGIFDGAVLRPTRRGGDGTQQDCRVAFTRDIWKWDDFSAPLADLRAARPKMCRRNYLALYANPGDIDFFDDAGWREIVHHWRLIARLAKLGGMRGILYDAEPYVKPYEQFRYGSQARKSRYRFDDYRKMARIRGRAVMAAVATEFPDIEIFTYRLFSDMLGALENANLNAALIDETYGLQPAFVDGWLDVAGASVRIVEGAEEIGYHANDPQTFLAGFGRLKLALPKFVAPEHEAKVNRQFFVGHSLYLDAYLNPPGDPYFIDSRSSTPAARLAANVGSALSATDALVWVYGETGRWWPGGDPKFPMWRSKFPGVVDALKLARNPESFARTATARGKNLLKNPSFMVDDGASAPWWTWQDDGQRGDWKFADGAVALIRMDGGVAGQNIAVVSGQLYAFRVATKSDAGCAPFVTISWKDIAEKWTAPEANRTFRPAPDGVVSGVVEAPAGASVLIFLLGSVRSAPNAGATRFQNPTLVAALPGK